MQDLSKVIVINLVFPAPPGHNKAVKSRSLGPGHVTGDGKRIARVVGKQRGVKHIRISPMDQIEPGIVEGQEQSLRTAFWSQR